MSKKLPVVAIVGRANVGKSSLFNRLLGERKAIVGDEPGTTRDRVEAIVEWSGKSFWLVDTAGFETGKEDIKQSVHDQIQIAKDEADLILIVLDGSTILSDEDSRVIKDIQKLGSDFVIAINKSDRAAQPLEQNKLPKSKTIPVSAIHGTGSGDLLDAITETMPKAKSGSDAIMPSLALLGRPNVGKSSLMNVLAGQERAVVSDVPGTTRDALDIRVPYEDTTWQITDTAGLRHKNKTRKENLEKFSAFRALHAINQSDVCALVLDANEPSTAQDQRLAGMVKEAGKGLMLIVNKWDQTERTDSSRKQLEFMLENTYQYVWWAPLILTSATQKHNVNKLLPMADTIYSNRAQKIPTNKLNKVLEEATHSHPPAGLKNKHPKLNYITQTDTSPPTFAVFGTHTPFLHWSYKRYLETQLRETFDFTGTPIRLQWRSKHKDKQQVSGSK